MKKLLSGLFRKPPPPPTPAPAPVVKASPKADPAAEAKRTAQLIDEGKLDFAEFCRGRETLPETLAVAALCADPSRLGQLLEQIDNPAELSRLAIEGASSRVRQAAAGLIVEPAQLHDLLPKLRGKDKSVYRIIKGKCDLLLADQRKADAIAHEAASLRESLERHAKRPYDVLYAPIVETLTTRWHALPDTVENEVRQRCQQALDACNAVLAAHASAVAAQAAAVAAAAAAQEERDRARESERVARQQAAAEQAQAHQQAREHAAIAAAEARAAETQAEAEHHTAATQAQREIGSLIRLCGAALQRGDSRKAARFRAGLEEAMQIAPALPPYLARHLEQLDARLNELRQWKDYVVAPKRIELIEEMETLVGVEEEPEALAEHIRALQQEWRTINTGLASEAATAETERFQKAFQAAFKPCQAHFAAQAAVRREHLEARKQVVERLKAFEATLQTENPDYPFIVRVLREAPLEWRSHFPVDRDAGRAVEAEFHQGLDRLRAILNGWYERNVADKQALIAQVKYLATLEDTTQAIDGVKRLQGLWKDSGPVAREQHQALWEEFRGVCDAIYERRQQAYAQYSATLDAAKSQAAALCEQVEQAVNDSTSMEKAAAQTKAREWQAAFDAIGELPRNDARALRDRFERAVGKFEAGLAQQSQRDAAAGESNLFEAARHIRAFERAVLQGAPEAEREQLREAAAAFIAGVKHWPKGGLQALKQALVRANECDANEGAREKSLRMLCIRSEILSSSPTPAVDASLRSDYEMRLLMEGLGQARQADDRDWEAMRLEWIGIAAVAPELHEELERRFRTCLAKRPVNNAQDSKYKNHDGRDRETRRDRDRDGGRDGSPGGGRNGAGAGKPDNRARR